MIQNEFSEKSEKILIVDIILKLLLKYTKNVLTKVGPDDIIKSIQKR